MGRRSEIRDVIPESHHAGRRILQWQGNRRGSVPKHRAAVRGAADAGRVAPDSRRWSRPRKVLNVLAKSRMQPREKKLTFLSQKDGN